MITEYHTLSEIEDQVRRIPELVIECKVKTIVKKYIKEFLKSRNSYSYPMVYSKVHSFTYNKNTFVYIIGADTNKLDSLNMNMYLKLNTSTGIRYYRITSDNRVFAISKHYIERFIERSPYNCNKDNFLVYLSKDYAECIADEEVSYLPTRSGLAVFTENTYITYLSDLSKTKEQLKREALSKVTQYHILNTKEQLLNKIKR